MLHLDFLALGWGFGLITALYTHNQHNHSTPSQPFEFSSMILGYNALNSLIKNTLQIPLRQRGALQILDRADLLGDLHGLFVLDGRHFALAQLLAHFRVVAQVELGADEDDGDAGGVVLDFGEPLLHAHGAC